MADNRNEVTVDNSVLILIDHQPWVAFAVNSIDPSLLSNNLEGLASSAKALDVPVILTTVGAEGGKLRNPLMKAVADVFPDKTPIDRTSTNAWADIRVVQAGATPINWVAVVCEWAPDFTSDERHKVNPAVMKNGAGVGLAPEQAFAQS